MFRKLNTTILIVILVVLLAVYLIVRYAGNNDRSFRETILTFDEQDVTELVINDPSFKEPIILLREGKDWVVMKKGKKYPADSNVVKSSIAQLAGLKIKAYAGKGEEAWKRCQVADTSATIVDLKKGKENISTILIGKFEYFQIQSQQPQMSGLQPETEISTYVRLLDEKEVYLVEGFVRMNFSNGADTYRNRSIIHVKNSDITRVTFRYPDETMVLERAGDKWALDGQLTDSVKTAKFFSMIPKLSNSYFVDEEIVTANPEYTIIVEGTSFSPVEITAIPVADTNIRYAIHSNFNPTAYFDGQKTSQFKRVFVKRGDFFADEAK